MKVMSESRLNSYNNTELVQSLKRWIEIANTVHWSGNWDECSLLHSFSDQLSRDLQMAVKLIESQE